MSLLSFISNKKEAPKQEVPKQAPVIIAVEKSKLI